MRSVYLAVYGDNLARRGGFAPSACYALVRDNHVERCFRSAGLLKNTQDYYAHAVASLLCIFWKEDEEAVDLNRPPSCQFICRNDGFKSKFEEVELPMQQGGLNALGVAYDGFPIWKRTKALVLISGSSIRKQHDKSELMLVDDLRNSARQYARGTVNLPTVEDGFLMLEVGAGGQ